MDDNNATLLKILKIDRSIEDYKYIGRIDNLYWETNCDRLFIRLLTV